MDILDRLQRKRQRRGNYDSLSLRSMKDLELKMTTYLEEENTRLKDELNELRCHLKLYQDEVNSLRNNLDIAEETKHDSLVEYNKNIENTYQKRIQVLKDENKILSDMIESFRERLVRDESPPPSPPSPPIEPEKKTKQSSSMTSKTEQPAAQSVTPEAMLRASGLAAEQPSVSLKPAGLEPQALIKAQSVKTKRVKTKNIKQQQPRWT